MAPKVGPDGGLDSLRHIPLSYNNADSQASALRLVLTLFPGWEHTGGKVEFVRFKDGITNTVRQTRFGLAGRARIVDFELLD